MAGGADRARRPAPLANRVDPFGTLRADPARGLLTGNRGVIHDPDTRTLLGRRWTTRAWIACRLDQAGRRRDVMGRNAAGGGAGWTELFFLDEATALAAGHRPCFFCRRAAAVDFARRFALGNGMEHARAGDVDRRLHGERLAATGREPPPLAEPWDALPDGAIVAREGAAFAKRGRHLLPWRFGGYGGPLALAALPANGWRLVTPPSTVEALRAGYGPLWHPTAGMASQPAPVSPFSALTGLDSGEPS